MRTLFWLPVAFMLTGCGEGIATRPRVAKPDLSPPLTQPSAEKPNSAVGLYSETAVSLALTQLKSPDPEVRKTAVTRLTPSSLPGEKRDVEVVTKTIPSALLPVRKRAS